MKYILPSFVVCCLSMLLLFGGGQARPRRKAMLRNQINGRGSFSFLPHIAYWLNVIFRVVVSEHDVYDLMFFSDVGFCALHCIYNKKDKNVYQHDKGIQFVIDKDKLNSNHHDKVITQNEFKVRRFRHEAKN